MIPKHYSFKSAIRKKGLRKDWLAEQLGVPEAYISHAINIKSPRHYHPKILEIKERLFLLLNPIENKDL